MSVERSRLKRIRRQSTEIERLRREVAILRRENEQLTEGMTCFSCGEAYTEQNKHERCSMAHREEWGHEWVTPRVIKLTEMVCGLRAELEVSE